MQYFKSVISAFFLFVSCDGIDSSERFGICTDQSNKIEYKRVTFEELLKAPQAYKTSKIEVEGFITFEFENVGIYSNRNFEVGYWINFERSMFEYENKLVGFNKKKALIRGIFNPEKKGHLNMFRGEIDSVICIIRE